MELCAHSKHTMFACLSLNDDTLKFSFADRQMWKKDKAYWLVFCTIFKILFITISVI